VRTHLTRRVLAGVTSLTIGGAFVAASAMAAMADSPSPTSITANVVNNAGPTPPAGTVTVTVSGNLAWKNGGACGNNKFAGYAIVWGDKLNPGFPVSGTVAVGTTLDKFGEGVDNLVHDSACNGNTATFGPAHHTYASSTDMPAQVCAVAYHYDNKSASGSHSRIAGGAGHNTDNSLEEPNAGLPSVVCVDVVAHKPDVTIAKTATPQVNVGDTITYGLTASNDSDFATDQTVTVTDPMPAGTQFVSVAADPTVWTCNNASPVSCTLKNPLAAHSSASAITIKATALAAAKPSVTNTATIDTPDDADKTNNSASASTVVSDAPQPDVTIKKTATPSVIVGDAITYTIKVTNDSTIDTDKTLTVTDDLPAGVQFKSIDPNGWSCNTGAHLTCTYAGKVSAGKSAPVITVVATALAGAVPSVTNVADVTNPDDSNLNNNEDDATTVVDVTAPVLSLTKSAVPADGSTVEGDDRIDYTLHYANTGNGAADNAVITDNVPAHTSYVAGSAACGTGCTASYDSASDQVSWTLDIAAGGTGSVTFAVTVNSDAPDGTVIDNVGQLTSGTHKVPSNHVHHLVFVPSGDLRLHKSVDKSEAKAGETLTYTLVAKATGNITQHDVVVTDDVPAGTTFKSANCNSPCTASQSGGVVTWHLGDMQPGDDESLIFTVTINQPAADGTLPTEIPNVGHVKSHETPKTPSNRVVTTITTVLGTKIVKTTPPAASLPFTGLPVMQDVLLAMVLIGGGILLLTWPRLYGNRAQAV